MSRKNKTLRAFLHQNPNLILKQAWDAAWKHAQKSLHARSMQDLEKQVADLQAEVGRLVEALERIASWPDGGNQSGQTNIQRFAAITLAPIGKEMKHD